MGDAEVVLAEAAQWYLKVHEAVTASLLDIVPQMPLELAQSMGEHLIAALAARGFIVEEAGS